MKNYFYSIVLAGLSALPAQAMNSELSIGMANNQKFTLVFDNSFYGTPSNTYNVTNIFAGNHHVRMTSVPVNINGFCAMPQLLFDGWISIPQNARVTAFANNCSQLNVVSVVPLAQQPYCGTGYEQGNPYGNGYGQSNPYGNGYGNGYNNGYNNGYGNGNGYNNGNPHGNGYGNGNPHGNGPNDGNGYGNGGWNNYPPVYGMSANDFDALKNSIDAQAFDSNRLTVAKQAIGSNNLTAAQVKEVVELMTFESSKVDLAKYAYGHTIDRNNYYLVNNAFTFSSSTDELADYISNYHA